MNPDWWQRGVVYQLYLRSFADSDGDGVGDLPGVIAHLDHLNDGTPGSLGVDAILLSPMYPSPGFDVGYDVSDYRAIDPAFGTMDDFTTLLDAAHRRGTAVIVDLVMNHTSHLHPWFVASRESQTGPYADWYLWRDPIRRGWRGRRRPPNNWVSFFGGRAWTWDPGRGQFYLHTFLPQQPDLNWRSPDVRAAMLDMIGFWLNLGVDGFRLDVFNVFFKDRDLTSNPRHWRGGVRRWDRQRHLHNKDQPELNEFLMEFRSLL
ncbi:MAG TPA: alpha-amylase family glycosyl hydrolase, partial [Pleomorphomonadaceae bacterium]|nr:alpha-amylase family glycosyl hydrolase [Pleomorphomonadaceae bacterium]